MFAALRKLLTGRFGPSAETHAPEAENAKILRSTVDGIHPEITETTPSHAVPYDENLLERARTQWQFGDWENLAKLERDTLQYHPDRGELMMLAAAGRLQMGHTTEARQYVLLAQDWGVNKKAIAQVLVAGTFNSLGKAAVMGGQHQRGLEYFKASVSTGMPNGDIRLLSQARVQRECEQLGNNCALTHASENQSLIKIEEQQTLEQMYAMHKGKVSDKWTSYLFEYDQIFSGYRKKPVRLLEVGVQNGGSLEIWAKYFPNAHEIIGCDINPKCGELDFEDRRISVIVGDINSDEVEQRISNKAPTIDIIIDDGSHRSSDIVQTFARYFPYLNDGGIYIAEDLHCSYWQNWEGGLFAPHSSMNFFKHLADIINYEHWGVSNSRKDIFINFQHRISESMLQSIHSIHFFNSLCIVRKEKLSLNHLRERFISGSEAKTDGEIFSLHGSRCPQGDESKNPWSKFKECLNKSEKSS